MRVTTLLGFVGVRVSRAEAGPLLNRFLDIAFFGLCFLVLVVGGIGLLLLRRYIYNQSELERRLTRATEDLIRSESVAKVGHWSQDVINGVSYWSDEMFAIYGRDPKSFVLTNEAVLSCIVPEDRERYQSQVNRMVETSGGLGLETRIQHPDGTIRHVFIKGGTELNDAGGVVRRFGVTQDITERKEVELSLTRNKDMLDRAIEASAAGIWDWDIIEDRMYTTPQMPEMLGYSEEEWYPSITLHMDLCHPDDLDRMQKMFQDHLNGEGPYDIEYRVRRGDGAYMWIHNRGRAIRDEHGIVTRMVGSVTDVTQRRREQELLRKNQETLELAIKAAEAGFFDREWDQDDIYWSPRLKKILGITDESFAPTAKSFNALVHPDDREVLRRNVVDFQESDQKLEMECRLKHADERWIWVQIRAELQKNEIGEPVRSVGFIVDITDRKKIALEIESNKEKLELALEASGAGYFDQDRIAGVIDWSPQTYDILGFSRSFVPEPTTFVSLIHPDDVDRFTKSLKELHRTGAPLDEEVRVRHADGQFIWVQIKANRHADELGQIDRSIGFILDISDRKRIEHELEESKKLFEDVATAAGEYIWEFNNKGVFTFVSERVEAVLGRPASDVVGRSPFDFMDHKTARTMRSRFKKLMTLKKGFKGLEIPGFNNQGSVVWQRLSGTPILDGEDKIVGYRGVAADITAQREAEEAVVRSEKKFRDLIEGSIQGLVIHQKFKPVFVNDAYAHMLGFENAVEMSDVDSLTEFLSPDFLDHSEEFYEAAISGKFGSKPVLGQMIDRNGNQIWTQVASRPVDWDGEPALQHTVIDITDQHRSEQALKDSEERFRVVAENATDLITIRNPKGNLTYASPSAQAVTGYAPDELLTLPQNSMVHERDTVKLEQLRDSRNAGKSVGSDPVLWRLRRKDGQLIWLETSSTSLPLAEGETGHRVLSMSRDVTERVEREQELEAVRDRLSRQAEELTELAERLEEEREKAEEANIAKSQFLAKMSHELRTPMTGVLGMVDLLRQTAVDGEQEDMLNVLHRSASALLDLLNDILDVSKIEAGELEIEAIDFRLSDVIRDVRELFEPVLSSKGLTFEVKTEAGIEDVLRGDPTRLRQVLLNLIGNANKFTETGGVILSLSQQRNSPQSITLRAEVADTGVGIAREDQNRLFQAFTQAEAGTTRKYGGTGLGLAICQQLVEAMGGMIMVDSELDEGSTFIFTVQVAPGDEAKIEERTPVVRHIQGLADQPLRILVAEDNDTTQMLVRSMLERNGHAVVTADNGELAVSAARRQEFDIILMDMQMPVMDGPQAMRAIRSLPGEIASRPIIALTADAIREHRQGYLDAGADIIVTKPVNWPILFSEMARLTDQGVSTNNGHL